MGEVHLDEITLPSTSKIVISSQYYERWRSAKSYEEKWEQLNLFDVNECVRNKLTDGDIYGILVYIDAKNKLKILRLPNCINVRGYGLDPLRDSAVLEEIDMSLDSYGRPIIIDPTPIVSENAVLPILQSILDKDGNSLKYLCFPKIWKEDQTEVLSLFLDIENSESDGHHGISETVV